MITTLTVTITKSRPYWYELVLVIGLQLVTVKASIEVVAEGQYELGYFGKLRMS